MYAASIDTMQFTFQASGSLWQDALVMQDPETESLWSQITGECIQGPMRGAALELVPSFHTTFAEFKTLYPHGLVLKKPKRGEAGSVYKKYFEDPDKLGMFGRANTFEDLPAKSKVFGLRWEDGQVAITEARLAKDGMVFLKGHHPPVVVTFDAATQTAAAFSLPDDQTEAAGALTLADGVIEADGGTLGWNAKSGSAVRGSAGDLDPVPLISAFWFAWMSFFPGTEIIK